MSDLIFRRDYLVHVYEAGFDGLLQPCALFNYLQDIAAIHAEKLGFGRSDLMEINRFWVLSRIKVSILRWPAWKEIITVSTWPRGTEGLFAIRDFMVTGSDGDEIASATSSWLIIDTSTKKIRRPHDDLKRFNPAKNETPATGSFAEKIEIPPVEMSVSPVNTVKSGDIDVNMHTNNTSYVRWIFDTYDPGFRAEMVPVKIEANYLAESRYGDNFNIFSGSDNNFRYHSVKDESGSKEYCRLRIEWVNGRHH